MKHYAFLPILTIALAGVASISISDSANKQAFVEMTDGSGAVIASSGRGRIRYNETLDRFEQACGGQAWAPISSSTGGGGGGGGVTSITGTTNQVIASASTGAVTLSLPQSIAATSAVQFGSVSVPGSGSGSQEFGTATAAQANGLAVGVNAELQAGGGTSGTILLQAGAGSTTTNMHNSVCITANGTGTITAIDNSSPGSTIDRCVLISVADGLAHNYTRLHEGVFIGNGIWSSAYGVALGYNTTLAQDWNVVLGAGCGDGGYTKTVAIGAHVINQSSGEIRIGGSDYPGAGHLMSRLVFNNASTAPIATFSINSSEGSGSGKAGSAIAITGGQSGDTATAGGGIDFATCRAGSGQTYTSAMTIHSDGILQYRNCTYSGSGSAALGNNCPAVNPNQPYTWLKVRADDGTVGYIPFYR